MSRFIPAIWPQAISVNTGQSGTHGIPVKKASPKETLTIPYSYRTKLLRKLRRFCQFYCRMFLSSSGTYYSTPFPFPSLFTSSTQLCVVYTLFTQYQTVLVLILLHSSRTSVNYTSTHRYYSTSTSCICIYMIKFFLCSLYCPG